MGNANLFFFFPFLFRIVCLSFPSSRYRSILVINSKSTGEELFQQAMEEELYMKEMEKINVAWGIQAQRGVALMIPKDSQDLNTANQSGL